MCDSDEQYMCAAKMLDRIHAIKALTFRREKVISKAISLCVCGWKESLRKRAVCDLLSRWQHFVRWSVRLACVPANPLIVFSLWTAWHVVMTQSEVSRLRHLLAVGRVKQIQRDQLPVTYKTYLARLWVWARQKLLFFLLFYFLSNFDLRVSKETTL